MFHFDFPTARIVPKQSLKSSFPVFLPFSYLRSRSRTSSRSREDENLIEIPIGSCRVDQRSNCQLNEKRILPDGLKDASTDFGQICSIVSSSVDEQDQIEKHEKNDRQIDRLVPRETGIGKDIVPVDRSGKNEETSGKGRQMTRQTVSLKMVRLWTHEETGGSPRLIPIEIITTRGERTKSVVRCGIKRFISDQGWCGMQFSNTEDHELMTGGSLIVNEDSKQALVIQI